MQFEEKLDVIEEDIVQYSQELLNILLKDRTTKENIIWATSDYISHGELYAATEQIYASLITGVHSKLIQPRVAKAHEQKNSRTRDKAEVFTPSWICNAQNNLVDEHWFGRPNVFNIPQDNTWTATERIVFPEDKQHTWKHYVDARRIEISCGEAPYLVSRYDTVTGDPIELLSRIGFLDRKLRVVTENAVYEIVKLHIGRMFFPQWVGTDTLHLLSVIQKFFYFFKSLCNSTSGTMPKTCYINLTITIHKK